MLGMPGCVRRKGKGLAAAYTCCVLKIRLRTTCVVGAGQACSLFLLCGLGCDPHTKPGVLPLFLQVEQPLPYVVVQSRCMLARGGGSTGLVVHNRIVLWIQIFVQALEGKATQRRPVAMRHVPRGRGGNPVDEDGMDLHKRA
jgi:hypothetical protein